MEPNTLQANVGQPCPLCLELMTQEQVDEDLILMCINGHGMHLTAECGIRVMDETNTCPICRAQIDPNHGQTNVQYNPDNYAPWGDGGGGNAAVGGDGIGPMPTLPDHGPRYNGVIVLPAGSVDWGQAVINGANIEISGGVGGGYIDIDGGAINSAVEGSAYDVYDSTGNLLVAGATVDRDNGGGSYIFAFGSDALRL
jgi:hypothetical protein